eukprot:CAMPEP_0115289554 /NCGR_PEP_ID=MMETSP0270-20121206/63571_1 /TAXON_ID=71861 /ORGANISM="Scrippsiella trochoidea, Strain CCMP3099" /LENGTH=62 /DNA_ID=CAMNT_0002706741 /DNA_START=706 /DNA_END=894 /DNA_ORIENTATION=-
MNRRGTNKNQATTQKSATTAIPLPAVVVSSAATGASPTHSAAATILNTRDKRMLKRREAMFN